MFLVFGILCTCISYSFGYGDFPDNFLVILKGEEDEIRINSDNFKLIHNGTTYNYEQNNKENSTLPTNLTYEYGLLKYENTDYNCSGFWQIESSRKSFNYTVLVVNKLQETSTIPSEVIINKSDDEMKNYERVNIHMPKINGSTVSCFLLREDRRTEEAILYNSTTNSDIKFLIPPLYDCGVSMKFGSNDTGKWTLVQLDEGYQLHYGTFYVNIFSNQLEKTFTVEAIIGTSYKFALGTLLNSQENILNCELVNPHGEKVVSTSMQCEYEISEVSNRDAGNWTMFYDIKKKHTTDKIIVNLIVHAPKVETVIEKTKSSDINLLCFVKFDAKKQFCYFQHPDGTIYRNHDFLGKEKYQFHTNYSDPTTTVRNSKYCGLTITSPDDSDFGAWRCYMGIQKQDSDWNAKVGSILHVESSSRIEPSAIQHKSSDMNVHLNETFEILCTANKIVEHCWLQRPDKMTFEIKESAQNYRYKYEGRGFSMGDCGATIENANFENTGDWKCIMKLMNDTQKVEAKIAVVVTQNLVEANQSVIIYRGSPIMMSCNVVRNETFDFDDCRWIKPNGYGIHFEYDKNYQLVHDHRKCSLHVEELNDEGNWTCVVESRIMEKFATATVNVIIVQNTNLTLILCLLATGFGIVASCITFFVCKKRLKHQRETELQLK